MSGGTRILWPLLGLLALLIFNVAATDGFLSVGLIDGRPYGPTVNIVVQAAKIVLVGVGMTLVIATGGVDLSVGSVMAIAGAVAATVAAGAGAAVGVLAALAAGAAVGAANGALVSYLRIQPIIATLIFMVLGRGIAMLVADGQPVAIESRLLLGFGGLAPVLALAVFVGTFLLLNRTALGLFVASVGDNGVASRLCGLNSGLIKLLVYAFSGLCAAVAGLAAAGRVERADATRLGELVELDAIFAVVVGGTALAGGRFSLGGTVVGALLIQTLTITLINQGMPPEITPLPKAVVIVFVCLLQSPRFRRQVAAPFARLRKPAAQRP
ncbi:ABC transporter permease [soil metagenome]